MDAVPRDDEQGDLVPLVEFTLADLVLGGLVLPDDARSLEDASPQPETPAQRSATAPRQEPSAEPHPWPSPSLPSQRLPPPVILPPCRALVTAVEPEGWADPVVLRRRAADLALLLLAIAVAVFVVLVLTRPPGA